MALIFQNKMVRSPNSKARFNVKSYVSSLPTGSKNEKAKGICCLISDEADLEKGQSIQSCNRMLSFTTLSPNLWVTHEEDNEMGRWHASQ